MKKIILALFLFCSVASFAQTQQPSSTPTVNSSTAWYNLRAVRDSFYMFHLHDSFPAKYPTIIFHPDGNLYKSLGNGAAWSAIGSSGGLIDSLVYATWRRLYKVNDSMKVVYNGLYNFTNGYGLNLSGLTFKVDSNYLATRLRLQKVADSLGSIISNNPTIYTGDGTLSGDRRVSGQDLYTLTFDSTKGFKVGVDGDFTVRNYVLGFNPLIMAQTGNFLLSGNNGVVSANTFQVDESGALSLFSSDLSGNNYLSRLTISATADTAQALFFNTYLEVNNTHIKSINAQTQNGDNSNSFIAENNDGKYPTILLSKSDGRTDLKNIVIENAGNRFQVITQDDSYANSTSILESILSAVNGAASQVTFISTIDSTASGKTSRVVIEGAKGVGIETSSSIAQLAQTFLRNDNLANGVSQAMQTPSGADGKTFGIGVKVGATTYYAGTNGVADIGSLGAGTVTSVSALTLGTTGTDLSSSVANSTTTPVITLNVPTASASNRGALSSTDWSIFNNKQSAITFGTGVQAALGVNIGSAGSPVLFNGAGGTPTSLTLTNATGLPAAGGGTGQSSYAVGDLLYASASTTLSKLADVATGSVLVSGGVTTAPAYSSSPTISTSVTTPIINGGTASAGTLTFNSTTNGTKGKFFFGANSAFNEATGMLGLNQTSPGTSIDARLDAGFAGIAARSYGTGFYSTNQLFAARGTMASPTATQSGDVLGSISMGGMGTTAFAGRANMYGVATQTWTDANRGTKIYFETTPNNSSSPTTRLTMDQSGNVGIGTGATPISKLDVSGNFTLGATYSNTNAAPTNGALIQGNVSIGTTTNTNPLDVNGGVTIGSYAGVAAPSNGLIVSGNVGVNNSNPLSALQTTSFGLGYTAKTATYSSTSSDAIIEATSGTFTITLETAVSATGRIKSVVNSGAGIVTVACSGGQTIGGSVTQVLTSGQSIVAASNGTNWIIVASH